MNSETLTGVARGSYPIGQIDLRAPLRDSMTIDGACFLDADTAADAQALAALRERLFDVRSAVTTGTATMPTLAHSGCR